MGSVALSLAMTLVAAYILLPVVALFLQVAVNNSHSVITYLRYEIHMKYSIIHMNCHRAHLIV